MVHDIAIVTMVDQ